MNYFVYILTNQARKPFYTGVTSDLQRRIYEHKNDLYGHSEFVKKYKTKKLVYYEIYDNPTSAIYREKLIKKWRRDIKIEAIEGINSDWEDLYFKL